MVSGKEVLVAAAVFAVALISHSEGIMGGREAVAHSRPYMASIQVPERNQLKHICGGFVVANQWVMTAAHCVPNEPDGRKIVLGVHSLSQPEDTKQTFGILRVYKNPTFNPLNYDNDIALIMLDRPFVPSEAVKVVPFLRAGGTNPVTNEEVDTAGWGASNNLGSRPDKLKELFIDVFSPGLCGNANHFGSKFTRNMMCAYRVCPKPCRSRIKKEDSCDGDSGGPLLFNGVVVGITSNGGRKCGQLSKPGIYTIVSHYTDWIDATMAQQPAAAAAEQGS